MNDSQNLSLDFSFPGYEDIELSTKLLIRSAQRRKIKVEVLDRQANFLRLEQEHKVEYVKQASKTRLDSYLSFVCMEDKHISKLLLTQAGLKVPQGLCFASLAEGLEKYHQLAQLGTLVIKPATTNYGTAIHTVDTKNNLEGYSDYYIKALQQSFIHSERVIAEEFVPGNEYRFLVMGGQCQAICRRIPANVCGDGKLSIAELIEKKNQDPRRGLNHTTPLEKIQLAETEMANLEAASLSPQSIPPAGKKIFLRSNSNVSTGGDSLDCTDEIDPYYKDLAIKAAKVVEACMCGVDIIIPTPTHSKNRDYAILELNFNPTIYIHEYPFSGIPRPVSDKILDLLGFH